MLRNSMLIHNILKLNVNSCHFIRSNSNMVISDNPEVVDTLIVCVEWRLLLLPLLTEGQHLLIDGHTHQLRNHKLQIVDKSVRWEFLAEWLLSLFGPRQCRDMQHHHRRLLILLRLHALLLFGHSVLRNWLGDSRRLLLYQLCVCCSFFILQVLVLC